MTLSLVGGTSTIRHLKLSEEESAIVFSDNREVSVHLSKKKHKSDIHDYAAAVAYLSDDKEFVRMAIRRYRTHNPGGNNPPSVA